MSQEQEPVVLELAPLPREQIGPFLLLGVDKDAVDEQVEANWAQRVIWARKNQLGVPLEDINWAREIMREMERRIRADASSLNPDTIEGIQRQLAARYGFDGTGGPGWQPLDQEKPLADYTPATEVPVIADVQAAITVPEAPADLPVVAWLLDRFAREPIDPWALDLASNPGSAAE